MPLRARYKNRDVFAFDFDPDSWEAFRTEVKSDPEALRMPCCDSRACLRTSKRGERHFYHYRQGDCDVAPESKEHLLCKQRILEAVRSAGFTGTTEAGGRDWRADVLVELPGDTPWRVAFEVQLSYQPWEETIRRQERYRVDKVRGCWLFGARGGTIQKESKSVPAFDLEYNKKADDLEFWVALKSAKGERLKLEDFIAAMLKGQITWVKQCHVVRKNRLNFLQWRCYRCRETSFLCYAEDRSVRSCHCAIFDDDWNAGGRGHLPEDQNLQNRAYAFAKAKNLPFSQIKMRYSHTVKSSYLAHGCTHCGALVGRHGFTTRMLEVGYNEWSDEDDELAIDLGFEEYDEAFPHWCYFAEENKA